MLLRSHSRLLSHLTMKMAQPVNPVSPGELLKRVPEHWAAARKSGDLIFFESTSRDVPGSHRFEVRVCPSLGSKIMDAAKPPPEPEQKRVRTDAAERWSPFRPPYVPGLYVGCCDGVDGEDKLAVLLNKFAILPEHILLCPIVEESQSLPPTPAQLARVFSFIQAAARETSTNLLGFYNGGPGAGASQRWRHVQFIDGKGAPVYEWCKNLTFERKDRAIIHPTLPYLHIIHPLPALDSVPYPPSADDLAQLADKLSPILMRSLDLAFDALRRSGGERSQGWNMLITGEHLHLIPRSAPTFPLGNNLPPLDLNALGYAGLLLVKSAEEDVALNEVIAADPQGLVGVVGKCGIPREFGEQALAAEADVHGANGDDGLL